MNEFNLQKRLEELGEPSPELQQGSLPDDAIQKSIQGVITDLEIVNGIVNHVGYDRLPTIIDMLYENWANHNFGSEVQCIASSWRGKTKQKYGPGGYNRCVIIGVHDQHKDAFGNVFVTSPKFRMLSNDGPEERLW